MSHLVESHVAHNVDRRESSETKKPKETYYKKNLVSWCKLFSTRQTYVANKKLKVVSCNKLTVTVVGKHSTTQGSNLDQAAATWNGTGRRWLKVDGGWKEDDVQILRKRLKVSKITDQDHQPSIDLTPVPTVPSDRNLWTKNAFRMLLAHWIWTRVTLSIPWSKLRGDGVVVSSQFW